MRKKRLIEELRNSQERVRQLEELICPAESHEWKVYATDTRYYPDIELIGKTDFMVCTKCRQFKVSCTDW
mgnify:CR=1 FL=1